MEGLLECDLHMPISSFSRAALISLLTKVPPMGLMGLLGSFSRSWKRMESGSRSISSPGTGLGAQSDSGREKFGGTEFELIPRERDEAILLVGRSLKRGDV